MLTATDTTTGLLYICNPNNPTGTLTPRSDLEAFLPKVRSGVSVLIDEAYHDYVTPTGTYASWAARAAANPQLIVTRTFSKIYGLGGLRVGYAISSAETAKRLAARRLPMDVSVVAARVALATLSDPAYVKKIAKLNEDDRQEFFNQANARMLRCLDSQTNFVLLRTATTGKTWWTCSVPEACLSPRTILTSKSTFVYRSAPPGRHAGLLARLGCLDTASSHVMTCASEAKKWHLPSKDGYFKSEGVHLACRDLCGLAASANSRTYQAPDLFQRSQRSISESLVWPSLKIQRKTIFGRGPQGFCPRYLPE